MVYKWYILPIWYIRGTRFPLTTSSDHFAKSEVKRFRFLQGSHRNNQTLEVVLSTMNKFHGFGPAKDAEMVLKWTFFWGRLPNRPVKTTGEPVILGEVALFWKLLELSQWKNGIFSESFWKTEDHGFLPEILWMIRYPFFLSRSLFSRKLVRGF